MTKKTRRILFFGCLIFFLLAAPSVVLYSQGYRFDFEKKKIVQTGAFFFKVWPQGAEVYLSGKLKKKTSLLFGSVLISNLLPKKYSIEIKKEGYFSWKKNLEVKEKQVTEAKNIILFPKNPSFEVLDKETENFFFSPDGKKIILKKETENGWFLENLDLGSNPPTTSILPQVAPKGEFLDLEWSANSKKILIKTSQKEQIKNSLFDLTENKLISLDFLGKNIEKVSFHPKNSSKIFFLKKSNLYLTDYLANLTKKEILPEPLLEDLITYEVFPENIVWLAKDGFCYKSDFSGKTLEVLNLKPISVKEETKYKIFSQNQNVFLKEGRNLFFLDPNSRKFEKIFDSFKNLKFSPDLKKVVLSNNFEIWILYLKEELGQPQQKAKEKVFLTRFSKKIEDIFWLNSHYLIFNVGNKIKVVEIDDRDRINIIEFGQFENPKIFFSKKTLYVLSKNKLKVFKNFLP